MFRLERCYDPVPSPPVFQDRCVLAHSGQCAQPTELPLLCLVILSQVFCDVSSAERARQHLQALRLAAAGVSSGGEHPPGWVAREKARLGLGAPGGDLAAADWMHEDSDLVDDLLAPLPKQPQGTGRTGQQVGAQAAYGEAATRGPGAGAFVVGAGGGAGSSQQAPPDYALVCDCAIVLHAHCCPTLTATVVAASSAIAGGSWERQSRQWVSQVARPTRVLAVLLECNVHRTEVANTAFQSTTSRRVQKITSSLFVRMLLQAKAANAFICASS